MSDHIPDATKMVSDTPRTEEFDGEYSEWSPAKPKNWPAFARQLERELNESNDRIRLLIAERDTARLQADRHYKLREEFRELLGTDDVEHGVAVVRGLQERIKRMEEMYEGEIGENEQFLGSNLKGLLIRELNWSKERIKRLEEDLMDAKNKHAALVADVALYEDRGDRIKRLEEAGDAMMPSCFDRLAKLKWKQAKEAKL